MLRLWPGIGTGAPPDRARAGPVRARTIGRDPGGERTGGRRPCSTDVSRVDLLVHLALRRLLRHSHEAHDLVDIVGRHLLRIEQ